MFPISDLITTVLLTGDCTYAIEADTYSPVPESGNPFLRLLFLADTAKGIQENTNVLSDEKYFLNSLEKEITSNSIVCSAPKDAQAVVILGGNEGKGHNVLLTDVPSISPVPKNESLSHVSELDKEFLVAGKELADFKFFISSDLSSNKMSMLEFQELDINGNRLDIPDWPRNSYSPKFKEYMYVKSIADEITSQTLRIFFEGIEVHKVRILGHSWQGNDALIAVVMQDDIDDESFETFRQVSEVGELIDDFYTQQLVSTLAIPENTTSAQFRIPILSERDGNEAKTPLTLTFFDEDSQELVPATGLTVSPIYGTFTYLREESSENGIWEKIIVPEHAKTVRIQGNDWPGHAARLTGLPIIRWNQEKALLALEDFLEDLRTESKGIILIDTTAPPLGDESRALRPNNLSREYAKLGYGVVFFAFGSIHNQSIRPYPNVIQFDRTHFDDVVHFLAQADFTGTRTYICSSFPSLSAVCTMDYLNAAGWNTVYEVRDDMEEFNRVGYSKWYSPELERRMVSVADKIVTVSPALADKMETLVPGSTQKTVVVPNAVRPEIVNNTAFMRDLEQWETREDIVGYVGHLTSSWFDWRPVISAAESLPEYKFEIIGHGLPANIRLPRNMVFLGAKTHEELPEIVSRWKVGLIPFQPTPLTRGVDPNKLYEYIAWGLRTVSAPMGSVDSSPSTSVYRNLSDLIKQIDSYVKAPMTGEEMNALVEFLKNNKWSNRAITMIEIIGA